MASISTRAWKNKSGVTVRKHRVAFTDDGGKRRRRDFDTQRSASKFIETLSERRATGELTAADTERRTYKDAAEAFLQACEKGRDGTPPVEPRTLREYRVRIEQHVLPHVDSMPIAEFTKSDMRRIRDLIAASPIAIGSRRKHLFLAKAVARHAVYLDWLRVDPTLDVKIHRDNRREAKQIRRVKIHTREEMSAILATARQLAQRTGQQAHIAKCWRRYEVMIHIMVYAGLRMSELRGLPCKALDLKAGTVHVMQRADVDGILGPPKSQYGYRTIHIPDTVAEMLQDWIGDRTTGLAFPTDSGRPINHSNLAHRMWRKVQVEAKVTILNPHAARHFFASMLIHGGTRLKALQEAVGHHDPMFTMKVYGHLFTDPEDIALRREMAQKMETELAPEDDEE